MASPWGIFFPVSHVRTDQLGTTATSRRIAETRMQFSLFSEANDGGTERAALYEDLIETFD